MKYDRRSVRRKRELVASRGIKIQNKIKAILLVLVLLVVIAGIGGVGYVGYGYIKGILAETPDISTIDATPSGYMSTVLDEEGNVTAQLVGTGSNRVYVTIDEIPIDMQHAFVAIEDERFYEHNGIDLKGIIRAGAIGITSGSFSEGASTITQQLLKNNVFDGWTSETKTERLTRKLQEQYLAIELEREVDKDWIMENYLNTINLGQNTLGVEAASHRYFGKDVSEVTLSEAAVIAAITQNPSRFNPISHPDDNRDRRQKVLDNMKKQGYISQEEYDDAVADDVYSRINETNIEFETTTTNITSYFVDTLTEQVVEDLQTQLGYSEAQAYKAMYSGGLTIYSTQNPEIQAICDEAINNSDNYRDIPEKISFAYAITIQNMDGSVSNYSEQTMRNYLNETGQKDTLNYKDEEAAQEAIDAYREYLLEGGGTVVGESVTFTIQPQASMTVIDHKTGQVKALVGGRGDKVASKTLNRASGTLSQPGSTFKIITTYAPALDDGAVSLATSMLDEPITYDSGKVIRNSDGQYHGMVTIREAIKRSFNVIAIKTSREITIDRCYQSALDFGITTLTEQDKVEALPLGGITNGVSNLELTAAYAAIANGGVYNEPILYSKILDHDGNVLIDRVPESHAAIQETTAFLLTSAMEDVVSGGTGTAANFSGMSIAGKTGTTTASRDAWFAGFTPYYTCAIWGGYDDNSELESTRYTRAIWKDAMSQIHRDLEDIGFHQPDGIQRYSVCADSGLLATSGLCTQIRTEYFAGDSKPKKRCALHDSAVICKTSGKLAGEFCPEEEKETKSFLKDSRDPAMMKPTEVCDVHTSATIIDNLLNPNAPGTPATPATPETPSAPTDGGAAPQ